MQTRSGAQESELATASKVRRSRKRFWRWELFRQDDGPDCAAKSYKQDTLLAPV